MSNLPALDQLAIDISRFSTREMTVFPLGIDRWEACRREYEAWCQANRRPVLVAPIDRQNFIWRGIPIVIAGA